MKPRNLSPVPQSRIEGENRLCQVSSDLHTCPVALHEPATQTTLVSFCFVSLCSPDGFKLKESLRPSLPGARNTCAMLFGFGERFHHASQNNLALNLGLNLF